MAKVTSTMMKGTQGTIQGLTFVKSKRYGDHVRSKRGTIKPAVLNDAFVASKEQLLKANGPALLIFNAVREEHKDGTLWSRLLSVFRKELKEGRKPGVDCLKDLECSMDFRLERLIAISMNTFTVTIEKKKMRIAVKLLSQPVWKKARSIDGYQLEAVVVFPDFVKERVHKKVASGKFTWLAEKPGSTLLEAVIPPGVTEYILFIKLSGYVDGKPEMAPFAKGMRVVIVGKLKGEPVGRK